MLHEEVVVIVIGGAAIIPIASHSGHATAATADTSIERVDSANGRRLNEANDMFAGDRVVELELGVMFDQTLALRWSCYVMRLRKARMARVPWACIPVHSNNMEGSSPRLQFEARCGMLAMSSCLQSVDPVATLRPWSIDDCRVNRVRYHRMLESMSDAFGLQLWQSVDYIII